jgi:hypothetical protein
VIGLLRKHVPVVESSAMAVARNQKSKPVTWGHDISDISRNALIFIPK